MARFNMKDILGAQSKQSDTPHWDTTEIDLAKLIPSPDNQYGIRDIEALAASIAETGLLHNLVVQEKENGVYIIISGERRYHALRLLEKRTAPCLIIPKASATAKLQLLLANAMTRELTDYEKVMQAMELKAELARLKKEYHTFSGRMRENVADVLGVSAAQVGRWESIYKNLTPTQMEKFKDGEIGISEAYELSCSKSKQPLLQQAAEQEPQPSAPPATAAEVVLKEEKPSAELYSVHSGSEEIMDVAGVPQPFRRMTEYDEWGNASIIGMEGDDYYRDLDYDEVSLMSDVLNRLAAYEDTGKTPEEVAAWAKAERDRQI